MTISTLIRKAQGEGDGINTSFNFDYQVRSVGDIDVIYTDADGNDTMLAANLYSITLNAVPAGQLWARGGSVTYPLSGSPIATGTFITSVRTVQLSQDTSLINQGGYYPASVERAMDLFEMALQQVSESVDRSVKVDITSTTDPDQLIADLIQDAADAEAAAAAAAASAVIAQAAAASAAAGIQWADSGVTPTYVSTVSFTLLGNQTVDFHVGRRLKFTVTAGAVYGVINASAFTTLTTVTMTMVSPQVLDAGLSAVQLSLLRADVSAIPTIIPNLGLAVAGGLTVSAGAIDISGSGAGQLKFPASPNLSGNVNTLDDYKEGTWTPADSSGASLSLTVTTARFTKIGRLVEVEFDITYPTTANGANAEISGLPYATGGANATGGMCFYNTYSNTLPVACVINASSVTFQQGTTPLINSDLSGKILRAVLKYST